MQMQLLILSLLGVISISFAVINCSLVQEIYEFEYLRNIIREILLLSSIEIEY